MSKSLTIDRFWAKVDESAGPDACWPWTACVDKDGYGLFGVRQNVRAHRLAFELTEGQIPAGLQLDHLCRNRGCCNPRHLEPVTSRENTLRGNTIPAASAAKTHCVRGHEFVAENTRVTGRGYRICRACARLWWRTESTADATVREANELLGRTGR